MSINVKKLKYLYRDISRDFGFPCVRRLTGVSFPTQSSLLPLVKSSPYGDASHCLLHSSSAGWSSELVGWK